MPQKRPDIIELLKGVDPSVAQIEHLGSPAGKPQTLQFEVNGVDDPVGFVKKTIKATVWGKTIALRVLEDGKFF